MEIGGWELAQQLPGGRFGARWRATGPNAESVLLKQLYRLDTAAAPGFLEGAARIRAVPSPNLARGDEPVTDASGNWWLVEEWVEGVSLGALTEEHVLSTGQALGVARGVLGGLAALHTAGLVHGLVSPATVMLDLAGQPKLVDAGAWIADQEVAATDEYAAPEVAAAAAPSPASDVFSLGKLVGEMLSAGPVDGALAAVLATATSVDPEGRQPDAPALLAQLSQAAERAYGPLWWTLEGVGGAVASAVGAGTAGAAATAGVTAPGSAGVVSGSLGMGNAIVAGTEVAPGGAGIVTGVVKTGMRLNKLIPIIAGGVVVVVVAGIAVANTGGQKDRPETLNVPAAVSPTPSPSVTPTPTPTALSLAETVPDGTWNLTDTVTEVGGDAKAWEPPPKKGDVDKYSWVFSSTCTATGCSGKITRKSDAAEKAPPRQFTWDGKRLVITRVPRRESGKCTFDNGSPTGGKYTWVTTWTYDPKVETDPDGRVIKLLGKTRMTGKQKLTGNCGEPYGAVWQVIETTGAPA